MKQITLLLLTMCLSISGALWMPATVYAQSKASNGTGTGIGEPQITISTNIVGTGDVYLVDIEMTGAETGKLQYVYSPQLLLDPNLIAGVSSGILNPFQQSFLDVANAATADENGYARLLETDATFGITSGQLASGNWNNPEWIAENVCPGLTASLTVAEGSDIDLAGFEDAYDYTVSSQNQVIADYIIGQTIQTEYLYVDGKLIQITIIILDIYRVNFHSVRLAKLVDESGFVPVTGIAGIPNTIDATFPYILNGIVAPENAANKIIAWSIIDAGTTNAMLKYGKELTARAEGTVVVRATIVDGIADGTDYTQDFAFEAKYKTITVYDTGADIISAYSGVITCGSETLNYIKNADGAFINRNGSGYEPVDLGSAVVWSDIASVAAYFFPGIEVTSKSEDLQLTGTIEDEPVYTTVTEYSYVDGELLFHTYIAETIVLHNVYAHVSVLTGTIYTPPARNYYVNFGVFVNGNVSASSRYVKEGETVRLTFTPDKGYELEAASVYKTGDIMLDLTIINSSTRSFIMPDSDVIVLANFKKTQAQLDKEAIEAIVAAIQNSIYSINQAEGNTEAEIKAWLIDRLNDLLKQLYDVQFRSSFNGTIVITTLDPAVAGSEANRAGENGSFKFNVTLSKGATTLATGEIPGNIVATSFVPTGIENAQQTTLVARIQNGTLYVGGLTVGEPWSVYSITGALIYQSIAHSGQAEVSLPVRGMYVVVSGMEKNKVN